MSASAVPEVMRAFKSLLDDSPEMRVADVQISYGEPPNVEREHVGFGDVDPWNQEWAAFGAKRRKETFTLRVFVYVAKPGDSQQEVSERAFDLLGIIEDLLREDLTLGLGSERIVGVEFKPIRERKALTDEGAQSLIEAGLSVEARI